MIRKLRTPAENLVYAIFGKDNLFLTDEGTKAVDDLLNEMTIDHRREVLVLRLRYGFIPLTDAEIKGKTNPFYSNSRTLAEVAVYFYVTRERIRQIEAKALRRLRHHSRSSKIRPYLTNEDD